MTETARAADVGTRTGRSVLRRFLLTSTALIGLQVGAVMLSQPALAQQAWDGDNDSGTGVATNGALEGGSGDWNATEDNFTTDGGTTNTTYTTANGDVTFGATAGTVAVDAGGVAVTGMSFTTDGYLVTGPGAIALNGTGATAVSVGTSGDTATISANITNGTNNTLQKTGTGTLALSGTNTFANLDIDGGTVQLDSATAFGNTGNVNVGGATLDLGGNSFSTNSFIGQNATLNNGTLSSSNNFQVQNATIGAVLGGTGGLNTVGNGTVTLNGANTYTGNTSVSIGTVKIGASERISNSSNLVMSGGTFDLNNFTETVNDFSGSGAVTTGGPNGRLNVTVAGTSTYSGTFSGATGVALDYFTKSGSGTLTLTGTNTTTGAGRMQVNSGTLRVSGGNAVGDNNLITALTAGSVFEFLDDETVGSFNGTAGTFQLNANTVTLAGVGFTVAVQNQGVVAGVDGNLVIDSSPPFLISMEGANTYTGSTTITSGTLILQYGGSQTSTDITINGGTLDVRNGGLAAGSTIDLSSGTFTVSSVAESITSLTQSGGTVNGTAGLAVTSGSSSAILMNGGSISTDLTVTGGITINSGVNTLSGTNTISGGITVAGGTLSLGSSGAAGGATGTITTTGSVIDYANGIDNAAAINVNSNTTQLQVTTGSATQSGNISETSGPRPIEKIGAGELILSGTNTYTGTTTVSAGTLTVSGGAAIADTGLVSVASGATFGLNANEAIGNLTGAGSVSLGSNTLTVAGSDTQTFSGAISGTGGFTRTGTGTTTLTGTNTYTGTTDVSSSTLAVTGSGTLASTLVGVGGTGSLMTDGGAFAAGSFVLVNGTATVRLTGNETLAGIATATGTTLNLDGGTVTMTGNPTLDGNVIGTGGITVAGPFGNVTLAGTNTYTGDTTIDSGAILHVSGGAAIADTGAVIANGTFDVKSSETIGSLSGAGSVTLGSKDLTVGSANTSTTFSGVISGTGGLTKNGTGTLTLTGVNTFSGFMDIIDGGTLALTGSGALAAADVTVFNGALTTDGGAFNSNTIVGLITGTVTFDGDETIATLSTWSGQSTVLNGATVTMAGAGYFATSAGNMSGTGGITMNGAGSELLLSGTNTFTGLTTVTDGTLRIRGGNAISDSAQVLLDGGTFQLDGRETVGNISSTASGGSLNLRNFVLTTGGDDADTTLSAIISGTGSIVKEGSGTFTLSGANTFSGGITIAEGTLSLASDTAAGTGTITTTGSVIDYADGVTIANPINVNSDTTQVQVTTGTATQAGDISETGGARPLEKIGVGTLILSGTNTYTGTTTISAGTLSLSGGAAIADTARVDVAAAGTLALQSDETIGSLSGSGAVELGSSTLTTGADGTDTTFAGGIAGTGALAKSGAGTFTLSGSNSYSGGTTISAGTLVSDTASLQGDIANAAALIFDQGFDGTFASVISGTGSFTKSGTGTLTLSGDSSAYGGTTTVSAGALVVNGALGGTTTVSGGTLFGTGTLGTLALQSGGTLAPGNSIGTISATNASFASGSTYAVELNDGGYVAGTNNDLLAASGTLTLTGGTVTVMPENGTDTGATYTEGTYTIATAAGGVSGTFDGVTDSFAFIDFALGYSATNVTLTSSLATSFASLTTTPNQAAVAAATQSLGAGNAVYDAVLFLPTAAAAQGAFDQLSGEGHATAGSIFLDNGRYVRDAMLGQDGAQGTWARATGGFGTLAGDGNAAAAQFGSGLVMAGLNGSFGDAWVGATVHAGQTWFSVPARNMTGKSGDVGAGVYAGYSLGDTHIKAGADVTHHSVETTRTVAFAGFSDTLTASYGATTAQVFGEVSHDFTFGRTTISPFLRGGYVATWTQGFTETGGAAALTAAPQMAGGFFATIGARAAYEVDLSGGGSATFSAMIGYNHFFGAAPSMNAGFATGSGFTVAGAPVARSSLAFGLGARFDLNEAASIDLNYQGRYAPGGLDHAVSVNASFRF